MFNLEDVLHDYFSSDAWKYEDQMTDDMKPHFIACMEAVLPKFGVGQEVSMTNNVLSISFGVVSKVYIREDGYYYDFDYTVPDSDLGGGYKSWYADAPERQLTAINKVT